MRRFVSSGFVLLALGVTGLWGAAETDFGPILVNTEYQYKLVLRLGDPVKVLDRPGPSWCIPFIDRVTTFEKRLQYLDANPAEVLISGGQRLIVDYYAVWRITDPLAFYRSFRGEMNAAEERIQAKANAIVGAKIGRLNLAQLLERSEDLRSIHLEASAELADDGVEVVDVRLNRAEIPRQAQPAVYSQMRERLRAQAREHRAGGERRAREVRAEAAREARTIQADARSKAETLRGAGDAESARIYAEAYGKEPEFYAFMRSLEAYRKSIGERTTMILPPDHAFFRYLASGAKREAGQ